MAIKTFCINLNFKYSNVNIYVRLACFLFILQQSIISRRQIRSTRCARFSSLKWLIYLALLLLQLIGLILFAMWAVDCFFSEFRTTTMCEHFHLFPVPRRLEFLWLLCSSIGSSFLIVYVICFSSAFCGAKKTISHLVKKKYFYTINSVLTAVVAYDIYVMANDPQIEKTIAYLGFIMEKSLTVFLMFLLNFLPR